MGLVAVPQMVAQAQTEGTLDYMRSLPIPRVVYLLADLTVQLAIVLPGVVFGVVIATLWFDLPLAPSPLVVPSVVLVVLTATAVGYGMAAVLPPLMANLMSQVLVVLVFMFSPLNFPADRLPDWLATLHSVLPIQAMGEVLRGRSRRRRSRSRRARSRCSPPGPRRLRGHLADPRPPRVAAATPARPRPTGPRARPAGPLPGRARPSAAARGPASPAAATRGRGARRGTPEVEGGAVARAELGPQPLDLALADLVGEGLARPDDVAVGLDVRRRSRSVRRDGGRRRPTPGPCGARGSPCRRPGGRPATPAPPSIPKRSPSLRKRPISSASRSE